MIWSDSHTHAIFLGIGGVGMSSLALHLLGKGMCVAGYDRSPSAITRQLEAAGALLYYSEADFELLPDDFKSPETCFMVFTPAIPSDFSWFTRLLELGLTPVKRAKVLAQLVNPLRCIAVAGTHGKTSVSAMIAYMLWETDESMLAFVGGLLSDYSTNYLYREGGGDTWAVAEADEFDRSFLNLTPQLALVTSVEPDHLDIYGTREAVSEAFVAFSDRLVPGGIALFHHAVTIPLPTNGFRYGLDGQGDYWASDYHWENGCWNFELQFRSRILGHYRLPMPGIHNLTNAVGALAALHAMGFNPERAADALSRFGGIYRRMEKVAQTAECVYFDDYAHHPTELKAAISAARSYSPSARLQVFFQPHLYSRTRDFAADFAHALAQADEVVLLDIYPAREVPIEGVTSRLIGSYLSDSVPLVYATLDTAAESISADAQVILTLGAGSIESLREVIASRITNSMTKA